MRTILTGIILSVLAISVQAATYTVDPGGTADYTTISAALAVTTDGDTVIVNDGTYQESITMAAGVYLLAATGTTPVIQYDGIGTAGGAVIEVTDNDVVGVIDGFEITGDSGADTVGTVILSTQYGSGSKTFRNCSIHTFTARGLDLQQIQTQIVENCHIYDGGNYGIYNRGDGAGSAITKCRIEGMGSGGWDNAGIMMYTASNWTVSDNVIFDCNRYGIFVRGVVDVTVNNNIVFDCSRSGLHEHAGTSPNLTITNNTFYSNTTYSIDIEGDSSTVIKNNIMWGAGTDLYAAADNFVAGDVNNNCFGGFTNVDTTGMTYVMSDPLFVNTTAGSYDFNLQGTSPCLAAGSDGTEMGAYGSATPSTATGSLPVELSSISAAANGNTVVLSWTTATETDNLGFNVLRSAGGGAFVQINGALIPGAGTTTLPQSYSFTDAAPVAGASYKLEQVDTGGAKSYSAVVSVDGTSGITDRQFAIADFSLTNPSNGSAVITLPATAKATVTVLGTDGTVMATRTGTFAAGTNLVGSDLPAGTYFVRIITTEQNSAVKRMIVVK